MALSKKHYEQFADRLQQQLNDNHSALQAQTISLDVYQGVNDALLRLATKMCHDFKYDNPRFDRDRFLNACGF